MLGVGRSPGFLQPLNVAYLKSQIEAGQAPRAKKALQEICKMHRKGIYIRPDQLTGIEQSIIGLMYTLRSDEKVRRWALNALARLGREATCLEAVKHVLTDFRQDPQTLAAAIAAVYRLTHNPSNVLRGFDFEPQMVVLAALQHVNAKKLDLSSLPINVDVASPDVLKLALIVVGLNRAPPNMLNPRHTNGKMVKVLGGHHDPIVSQYTVWAITENPLLRISDLGIDLKHIERQPPNVRAWMLQLLAMTEEDAKKHLEYIVLGTSDRDVEVKAGLALGLKDTFFDGLDQIVLDWFVKEDSGEVSHLLMDHMIGQAKKCEAYESLVLDFYETEAQGSQLRQRMEAIAAGTPLYRKMKKIDVSRGSDLFGGEPNVTNNTYNINGGIQGAVVAVGGNAENTGTASIHYNPQTINAIRSELSKAEREIHGAEIGSDLKQEALQSIENAKADPTPDALTKVGAALGKINAVVVPTAGTVTALGTIGAAIGKLAGLW
jgi:hypothetical protein